MRIAILALALVACSHNAAPSARSAPSCPAAKATTDICAAVITYAKNPNGGACCEYPTPCGVPFDGPQYSDSSCAAAAPQ